MGYLSKRVSKSKWGYSHHYGLNSHHNCCCYYCSHDRACMGTASLMHCIKQVMLNLDCHSIILLLMTLLLLWPYTLNHLFPPTYFPLCFSPMLFLPSLIPYPIIYYTPFPHPYSITCICISIYWFVLSMPLLCPHHYTYTLYITTLSVHTTLPSYMYTTTPFMPALVA